jgi:hypothetical protein
VAAQPYLQWRNAAPQARRGGVVSGMPDLRSVTDRGSESSIKAPERRSTQESGVKTLGPVWGGDDGDWFYSTGACVTHMDEDVFARRHWLRHLGAV